MYHEQWFDRIQNTEFSFFHYILLLTRGEYLHLLECINAVYLIFIFNTLLEHNISITAIGVVVWHIIVITCHDVIIVKTIKPTCDLINSSKKFFTSWKSSRKYRPTRTLFAINLNWPLTKDNSGVRVNSLAWNKR